MADMDIDHDGAGDTVMSNANETADTHMSDTTDIVVYHGSIPKVGFSVHQSDDDLETPTTERVMKDVPLPAPEIPEH
ncbi:hypothetical protein LPJ67_001560, partial [Coemansia sp. RSA 1938]